MASLCVCRDRSMTRESQPARCADQDLRFLRGASTIFQQSRCWSFQSQPANLSPFQKIGRTAGPSTCPSQGGNVPSPRLMPSGMCAAPGVKFSRRLLERPSVFKKPTVSHQSFFAHPRPRSSRLQRSCKPVYVLLLSVFDLDLTHVRVAVSLGHITQSEV